jgi:hypothetical protein
MAQYDARLEEDRVSGWAIGGISFAGTMLIMIGVFQIIAGISAIAEDDFVVLTANYTFDLDVTAWGWIHLVLGVVMLATGFGLFAGMAWAAVTAITLAVLSAVANFFFIPYYPFWSLLVIGLNVWVIWAITRPGVLRT